MNGVTFGSGTFIKVLDDGTPLKLGDGIPTADDCAEAAKKATQALRTLGTAAKEATITFDAIGGSKCLWWRMLYGRPQRWPVSNNWLKMHGYPMRRRGWR